VVACGPDRVYQAQCDGSHRTSEYVPSLYPGLAGKDWRDVLGSDVLPDTERLRGKSMTGNRWPGPGIKDGAPGDPRDMVKAKLPEA
jgi:hypothetical protein